jgi:methionine synthase I (cobalamin-dependent)
MNIRNLFEQARTTNKPLILDGAMGTLLESKYPECSMTGQWMNKVILDNPNGLIEAHESYIKAGAQIITTNTYRTNPMNYELWGKSLNTSVG